MRALDIPFTETVVPLDTPEFSQRVDAISGAGKVPVLQDGDLTIWDSLAICEYLAEKFPGKRIWPADRAARAHARCASAEMHSGFSALRSSCPMNLGKRYAYRDRGEKTERDVGRIIDVWTEALKRFGTPAGGDFLYGEFSAADAMYAPVVTRLDTYGYDVPADVRTYMDRILSHPAFIDWKTAALAESWIIDHDEVDEPEIETYRNP